MKNLCLVQVVDSYGPNKFLPLAISYQWLQAQQNQFVADNWQVIDVLIEKININTWLESLTQQPHVVALSCYVWNWKYNQALAKKVKARWPGCVIVVGGPQVPKHDPDFIRNHPEFDIAVLGENESILEKVLIGTSIEQLTSTPGVITLLTQQITQPLRNDQLDDVPSPILTGFYDQIIQQYESKHNKMCLRHGSIQAISQAHSS